MKNNKKVPEDKRGGGITRLLALKILYAIYSRELVNKHETKILLST